MSMVKPSLGPLLLFCPIIEVMATTTALQLHCFHCGEYCRTDSIRMEDKVFCCEGCKMVYQLINRNGLCDYYSLNQQPGTTQQNRLRKDKFAFLDEENIQQQLRSFRDDVQTHVTLYLPQIHCSSCLYLLENAHKLNGGIVSVRVHFARKEAQIIFHHNEISLRQVAELLTGIGYEPYISLDNLRKRKPAAEKSSLYRLGIAGFCFANIMLLSFPEYLGLEKSERYLQVAFRFFSLFLSLPVFFYSAQPFFASAWKSLRARYLNIDAPIALAILITFSRSVYEVLSGTGSGYFDSMSGIVFFMLAGRVLQEKTYRQLSFDRDFAAYFPVAATVLQNNQEVPVALPDLKAGDTLLIHHEELIPADGILTRGKALVDYSFVTGESLPVLKEMGELIYAGGKQTGGNIELLLIHEVQQSYLTSLWNRSDINKKTKNTHPDTLLELLSRWFTCVVLTIAALTAVYWWQHDSSRIANAVTAIMIVACPCALLLSGTFTNGNVLRLLSRNRFYLRNAQVIEELTHIDHIVFDKTGTLTSGKKLDIYYNGKSLTKEQKQAFASLAAQSRHPLSKALAGYVSGRHCQVSGFSETTGKGISGCANGHQLSLGSETFVTGNRLYNGPETRVYIAWENNCLGYYTFHNHYRDHLQQLVQPLQQAYGLSVISGDNAGEKENLSRLMGKQVHLLFRQTPENKLQYVQQLQQAGHTVLMIGDGLNDAGALLQSDVGIAVADDCNTFTPASDIIMDASALHRLPLFIRLCRISKRIIIASFIMSTLYNIIGLCFAVSGTLSPLVAAILMPASSLSIALLTFGCTNLAARLLKL